MSLINQMLRDLEKRHSKDSEADFEDHADTGANNGPPHIPNGVTSRQRRVVLAVIALALLGCGAGAGWHLALQDTRRRIAFQPPAPAKVEAAEHISVPQQPAPAPPSVHNTVEDAAPHFPQSELQSTKVAPSVTSSRPAQTATAPQVAGLEEENTSPAPVNSGEAKRKKAAPQPVSLEKTAAASPPTQVESTCKVSISHASTPLEQRRRALSAAQQHYANADYSAAIRILQQHLEQNPAAQAGSRSGSAEITTVDALIYRQLALAQLRLNQTDAAINTLEQGHLRAPEDIELHMLYARMLLEQNGSERAYTMLRQMPQPQITKQPDFYALRAALARQQEAYIEAVELYSLLCRIYPERGDWRLGLALSQHQQGDLEQAHQNYQRAARNTRLDQKLRDFAARKARQMQTSYPGSS